jgi:putative aldouronate transport system permease protein
MLNVLAKSLSSEAAIISGRVTIFPIELNLDTYRYIFTQNYIRPFIIQASTTIGGTIYSLMLLVMIAYPLSRKKLAFKNAILVLIIFSMLFNPGMVPLYMLVRSLNLMNNLLALVLPIALTGFNILLVKSYMETISESVIESALIEGANHIQILLRIVIPFSIPILATMVLFNAVRYWNDYFGSLMYITKFNLKPLQLFLREMVLDTQSTLEQAFSKDAEAVLKTTPESVRATAIIATTMPILLVYPSLQRYYIKGIMIGSVKG